MTLMIAVSSLDTRPATGMSCAVGQGQNPLGRGRNHWEEAEVMGGWAGAQNAKKVKV